MIDFATGQRVCYWSKCRSGLPLNQHVGTVEGRTPKRIQVRVTEIEGASADYVAYVDPQNLMVME